LYFKRKLDLTVSVVSVRKRLRTIFLRSEVFFVVVVKAGIGDLLPHRWQPQILD